MDKPDLSRVPTSPGVYRFLDASGRVLYVGKAKHLRNRIASYFTGTPHPRTARMLGAAHELVWGTCRSEREALLLERELVVNLQPPFNVLLKEGSGYPGLALSKRSPARLTTWRDRAPQDAYVFGPYPQQSAKALREAVASAFGVRTCDDVEFSRARTRARACLLGETGRCLAPCLGREQESAHASAVADLTRFLDRPSRDLIDELRAAMGTAVNEERFEVAARLRDRITVLESLAQEQTVIGPRTWADVAVAVEADERLVVAVVVIVSGGRVRDIRILRSERDPEEDVPTTVSTAFAQVAASLNPSRPFLTYPPARNVGRPAARQREHQLLEFAVRHAQEALITSSAHPWLSGAGRTDAVAALGDALELTSPPWRIECIDVSHTAGQQQVASVVVMIDGQVAPAQFRTIRTPANGDDFAAIERVVTKRVTGTRMGLPALPDLLVVDGGPGQVQVAHAVLQAAGLQLPVIGLAKRLEEVWLPGASEPLILSRDSSALRLLQLVRDEAHRTAIGRHRRARDAQANRTLLDGVPGVGPARLSKLLAAFGTVDAVAAASSRDLQAVLGETLGAKTWTALHTPE